MTKIEIVNCMKDELSNFIKGMTIKRAILFIDGFFVFQYDPLSFLLRTFQCFEKDSSGFECECCGEKGFVNGIEDSDSWRSYGLCPDCVENATPFSRHDTFIDDGIWSFSGGVLIPNNPETFFDRVTKAKNFH